MKLMPFLKDKFMFLILHIICMGALSAFLRLTGYGSTGVTLILIFWTVILALWLFITYRERKRYFDEIDKILAEVDQRYLLGELLPYSCRLEDRLYNKMMHLSNKSVIEKIRKIEDAQRDYREYIESWVHEIKTPITGIALICENRRRHEAVTQENLREISLENQKIENCVDKVLYYARMENVYKDFLIQKTDLQKTAEEVLEKNRLLLIRHQVRAEVCCGDMVYTDGKWISFILNQMIGNSVKYRSESPVFLIYTEREKDGVRLTIEDNGVGILPEELSRIFEKGFTGSNGRSHRQATGMGLYLCKRLCERLEIGLSAQSQPGRGTKMTLDFPVSNYIKRE
ncbi:MAG: HAMP domain-containing histidine kinase [Lachnospiraceae bacterium]|jgi:signal transduction histidine kinase|nr:HAMP domain-containing histidine kinase [Lachnospiraceae bacterium]